MSFQSEVFFHDRQPGDCRPQADMVVYYDGVSADKPYVEAGTLAFLGGKANVPDQGIGYTGHAHDALRIAYGGLFNGGAGVKYRCPTADSRQRLRFTVAGPGSGDCNVPRPALVSLELKPLDTCGKAYQYEDEIPLFLFRKCSSLESDCQILENLARQFNEQYAHLGTAVTVMDGAIYAMDIITSLPGQTFRVMGIEGLSPARQIAPGSKRTFTRSLVQDFFGSTPDRPVIFNGVDANLNAAELFFTQEVEDSLMPGSSSNLSVTPGGFSTIRSSILVLFEDNVNANAALAELKVLMKGGGNKYLAKTVVDDCEDVLLFPYSIMRADAGTLADLTAVQTQYPTVKNIWRAGYVAGNSYYEVLTTTAATLPAPTVAQAGDVVTEGTALVPKPYSVSACPPATPCVDCPPVSYAIYG